MRALAACFLLLLAPAALADDERPEPVVVGFSVSEGRIVVRLRAGAAIDAKTLDVRVTRFLPGIGEEIVEMASVEAADDRIRLTPKALPLAEGQYAVAVLLPSNPVFHSFTVGRTAPEALRESVEALRDEVRALRNEIRELRALVERRSPAGR